MNLSKNYRQECEIYRSCPRLLEHQSYRKSIDCFAESIDSRNHGDVGADFQQSVKSKYALATGRQKEVIPHRCGNNRVNVSWGIEQIFQTLSEESEMVALALYSFMRYPDNYEKVIIRGANTSGDSDSIACIGGSISGTYLGIDAIPEDWVKRIEESSYLDALATRLVEKKGMLTG